MGMFDSLGTAFGAPLSSTLSSVTDKVGGLAQNFAAGATQTIAANFGLANPADKAAEALNKLKTGGTGAFNKLTGGVGIGEANKKIIAFDATTKVTIDVLGETSDQIPAVLTTNAKKTEDFKVKLVSSPDWGIGMKPDEEFTQAIIFKVMPQISESHSASYDDSSITPLHHPGAILKYRTTQARTWNITGKLIARSPEEALENLIAINTLRSWVMPFYGNGTGQDSAVKQWLGAPPPILTLSAYGDRTIGPVKCVLESYSWSWPDDVDYIQTYSHTDENKGTLTPFPVLITVQLQLKEAWSPAEFSGFDIVDYRKGYMFGRAFNSSNGLAAASNTDPQTSVPNPPMTTGDFARMDRSMAQNATDTTTTVPLGGTTDGWLDGQ